ncbi:hypothetical protein HPP92_016367 [Vanilla planifolia]|uniref:Uncharacterized protein n=1 Tax=Vanilla planifolia TaxID=51239 RepID=A0A835QIN9_VANPL|nr:hypothetical protein HPP92_016367 [Vanilla planifolia]
MPYSLRYNLFEYARCTETLQVDEDTMFSRSRAFPSLFVRSHDILHRCPPCSAYSSQTNSLSNGNIPGKKTSAVEEVAEREEAYHQLQNLDFKTAAKILFTTPPKRKKFGLDFHLVQLFFACMPSLAVYLVAQYARSEIRRMEAEAEQKKKQAEEEEKGEKETELVANGEPQSEMAEVKVRLEALEETVKEIIDEKRRTVPIDPSRNQEAGKPVTVPGDDKSSGKPGGIILPEEGKVSNKNIDGAERTSQESLAPKAKESLAQWGKST